MAYTEIQEKNKRKYYYRVKSIRKNKQVSKKRRYLGVDLSKEELKKAEKKADEELSHSNLFTRRQEFELITAIKGRGEIPLKFAYLGEGAKNWNNIAKQRSTKGGINTTEDILLNKKVKSFLSSYEGVEKVNVIDIGCGNGVPAFPILEELKRAKIDFCYIPIDISNEILEIAIKNISSKFKGLECKPFQLDFELGNFSDIIYDLKKDGSSNLLLFLGSTLGNHSDRGRVLTNFKDSMSSDDYLILGVELTNFTKINKILPHYKGKLVDDFVYFIPETIGIKKENTIYDVSWNDKLNQVEVRIILKKDETVKIGEERFVLEKDEQILIAISVKFTEWNITKLLSDVGFRTELLTTTEDRGYILTMVQPTRYEI